MLHRLKDTFRFKEEFLKWQRHAGLVELLAGNRVAEMHGLSASYGQEVDIACIRRIYLENHDKFLRLYQNEGLSSRQAALNLVCKMTHIYMQEKQLKTPPIEFLSLVSSLAPSYSPWRALLEKNWVTWLDEREKLYRKQSEEKMAFLPILSAARKEAHRLVADHVKGLDERKVPEEFFKFWRAIPDKTRKTEREISENAGLPLANCISWILALERRGLVGCTGTSLAEPSYGKTPPTTLKGQALDLRIFLDESQKSFK